MLTAYTTKDKLSNTRTNESMTAFFSKHFGNFISKHTQWSLLSEPESARITPKVLNVTRRELLELYDNEISGISGSKNNNLFHQDLN